ncbi:MAG: hypothetical protein R3E87_12295 [Burkholderiaceae bacterium]
MSLIERAAARLSENSAREQAAGKGAAESGVAASEASRLTDAALREQRRRLAKARAKVEAANPDLARQARARPDAAIAGPDGKAPAKPDPAIAGPDGKARGDTDATRAAASRSTEREALAATSVDSTGLAPTPAASPDPGESSPPSVAATDAGVRTPDAGGASAAAEAVSAGPVLKTDATSTDGADADDTAEIAADASDGQRGGKRSSVKRLKLRLSNIQGEYYLDRSGPAPAVVSQFRSIRRPLIANAQGRGLPAVDNGRTIMVTSAMPGEGKTFCSIHLGLAIASELDCKVVLIELDLIKPSLLKTLGVSPRHGITDWFKERDADIRDFVCDTNVRDLKILPSGSGASSAANMLASRRLENMFDQLRAAYPGHFIILDTPPVIPASEARVLPNYVGQVAFVVAAGETPASAVSEGLEYVQGAEVVGLIMNKFRPDKVYSSYGY